MLKYFFTITINILQINKIEIILEILKIIKEIFSLKAYLAMQATSEFKEILRYFEDEYSKIPKHAKHAKVMV